jgi:type VI secretion system protein ImpA
VVIALDSIIAYYKQQEPSSPVPFILARVRRLVIMNFMEVITELNPDALDKILNVTGPVQPSDQQKS